MYLSVFTKISPPQMTNKPNFTKQRKAPSGPPVAGLFIFSIVSYMLKTQPTRSLSGFCLVFY